MRITSENPYTNNLRAASIYLVQRKKNQWPPIDAGSDFSKVKGDEVRTSKWRFQLIVRWV